MCVFVSKKKIVYVCLGRKLSNTIITAKKRKKKKEKRKKKKRMYMSKQTKEIKHVYIEKKKQLVKSL